MNRRKFLRKLLQSQTNVRFQDIIWLASGFGFVLDHVSGSHHILIHPKTKAQLNIQNVHGEAKPYQIRQLLKLVEMYNLKLEDEQD